MCGILKYYFKQIISDWSPKTVHAVLKNFHREGGREAGREAGKEGERDGGREGRREGGRDIRRGERGGDGRRRAREGGSNNLLPLASPSVPSHPTPRRWR